MIKDPLHGKWHGNEANRQVTECHVDDEQVSCRSGLGIAHNYPTNAQIGEDAHNHEYSVRSILRLLTIFTREYSLKLSGRSFLLSTFNSNVIFQHSNWEKVGRLLCISLRNFWLTKSFARQVFAIAQESTIFSHCHYLEFLPFTRESSKNTASRAMCNFSISF